MKLEDLVNMKLHGAITIQNIGEENGIIVRKVPGGWIYEYCIDGKVSPVFVPVPANIGALI